MFFSPKKKNMTPVKCPPHTFCPGWLDRFNKKDVYMNPAWRIIPVSKWLVTPIYKPWKGHLGDLLTMVINHLLNGMILQVEGPIIIGNWVLMFIIPLVLNFGMKNCMHLSIWSNGIIFHQPRFLWIFCGSQIPFLFATFWGKSVVFEVAK